MRPVDAADFAQIGGGVAGPLFAAPGEGPFANSKLPRTPMEAAVAALIWQHRGRANPIPIARVCELTKLRERDVKGVVLQLVVAHRMMIGGSRREPHGYFMIQDAEDLVAATEPYEAQVLSSLRRLRALKGRERVREFLGQLRIEVESGDAGDDRALGG